MPIVPKVTTLATAKVISRLEAPMEGVSAVMAVTPQIEVPAAMSSHCSTTCRRARCVTLGWAATVENATCLPGCSWVEIPQTKDGPTMRACAGQTSPWSRRWVPEEHSGQGPLNAA